MGVHYRNIMTSLAGVEWKIDIHDPDYTDDPVLFLTEDPGFTYNYPNNETSRICGSEIIIHWMVQNSTELKFLIETIYKPEKYYTVMIYRDEVLWWFGKLFYNQQQFEDQYFPFRFDLKATDYLMIVANEPYNNEGLEFSGQETILKHFKNIIDRIGIDLYDTDDVLIRTVNNWHDVEHDLATPAGDDDPLFYTQVSHDAFINYDDFDEIKSLTCGEVMNELLTRFDCFICQKDGAFLIAQRNIFENATYPIRSYTKLLVYDGIETSFPLITGSLTAGGSTYFLPALKSVSSGYDFKQGINRGNLLPPVVLHANLYNLGEVTGGSSERLTFDGVIRLNHTGDPLLSSFFYASFIFRVQLTVGATDYYLTNEGGSMSWSTTNTKRVIFNSDPDLDSSNDWIIDFPLLFLSSEIPGTGTLRFLYEVQLFDVLGNPYSDTEVVSTALAFYMNYLYSDGSSQTGYQLWQAVNTDGVNQVNSEAIELEGITGDGVKEFSAGRLRVYDGSQYVNATLWNLHENGFDTELNIHRLLCTKMIARQKTPTAVYSGQIIVDDGVSFSGFHLMNKNFFNVSGLSYEALFICTMASYNPYDDLADCEWMLLLIDREDIDFPDLKLIETNRSIYHYSAESWVLSRLITT